LEINEEEKDEVLKKNLWTHGKLLAKE